AVSDAYLTGVDRPADSDAAAMVDRHPRCARGGIDEGVQQRPVGDGVRTVGHVLGLPVRGGDRAAIKMVPAEHHPRADLAPPDHLVEAQACLVPLAVPEPADSRGQALEIN